MSLGLTRAFTLALSGVQVDELAGILAGDGIDICAPRQDGMYRGWTLLHGAASKGQGLVVDLLLSMGATPCLDAINAQGKVRAAPHAPNAPNAHPGTSVTLRISSCADTLTAC